MKIAVIGAGYVGLTTASCLAEKGHFVICADNDLAKIKMLIKNKIPFYEQNLEKMVKKNTISKKLFFTNNLKSAVQNSDLIFCCVWTPPDKQFKPDTGAVFDVARNFGRHINKEKIFIIKSTVPVGTNEICRKIIQEELKKRKEKHKFYILSNPEFLRQGTAVKDTMKPDRIVVGLKEKKIKKVIQKLFKPFTSNERPLVFTTNNTAELIKYAANAFLATKISFINQIANFSEIKNCNIKDIEKSLKLDKRIGPYYLSSGSGYGGNCLRKDIKGLIKQGEENGFDFGILRQAEEVNEKQKLKQYYLLKKKLGSLKNKEIAVLGVAFKANTDSFNEAPSVKIVQKLLQDQAEVVIFDPKAGSKFVNMFKNSKLKEAKTAEQASKNADAVLVLI